MRMKTSRILTRTHRASALSKRFSITSGTFWFMMAFDNVIVDVIKDSKKHAQGFNPESLTC